jgi:hypothetical protein
MTYRTAEVAEASRVLQAWAADLEALRPFVDVTPVGDAAEKAWDEAVEGFRRAAMAYAEAVAKSFEAQS